MQNLFNQLIVYYQPVVVTLVGILLLSVVAYFNWYPGMKTGIVGWIKKNLYHNSQGSDVMADGMFMTATSYALAIGLGLVLIGGIYLSGIKL